jgi:L-alanine-DL-glutamate epimerase-like enolase superfamily enzyme
LKVIAELSNKNNIKIAPHLFMELNTHLNASIPNASWLEHMGWYNHLWVNPILPKDGTAVPPNIPGHGMAFKPELFKEYPYKKI